MTQLRQRMSEDMLERACELGLEGIIAKRLDRPYRSGRLGDWLKIKCIHSDSFVIIGYEPSTAVPGAFASLYLAAMKGDGLVYVGNVWALASNMMPPGSSAGSSMPSGSISPWCPSRAQEGRRRQSGARCRGRIPSLDPYGYATACFL